MPRRHVCREEDERASTATFTDKAKSEGNRKGTEERQNHERVVMEDKRRESEKQVNPCEVRERRLEARRQAGQPGGSRIPRKELLRRGGNRNQTPRRERGWRRGYRSNELILFAP